MRGLLTLLPALAAVWPASGIAQGAGYGPHGLDRNIPQERAREAYKVEKARGEEKLELLREQGHPRHGPPREKRERDETRDSRGRRR